MTAVLGKFSSGVRLRDPRCIPRGDIVDFDRHDIAATELAVDRKIEHGKVSDATFNLEFRPD
jgi:hypothetical protein